MSVLGELSRHLEGLVASLDEAGDAPRVRAVRRALEAARPNGSSDLTRSAEAILDVLGDCGLDRAADAQTPQEFSPESVEAARTVAALSRIVLGR